MATNSEIIDESIKQKKHRPDGTNIDRYKNLDKWSYKRWAWEFLRRNDNFIHECRRVAGGTAEDKEEVASTFGLKQFKDFREGYSSQGNRPRFSTGAISSWSNLNEENNKKSTKIKVASGQVLIRFDLMSAIADSESLTKQLKLATKRLERRVLAYSKEIGVEQKSHNHKITNFGFYLRILDALADNRPPKEIAEIVFPIQTKGADASSKRETVKNRILQAKSYANEKYRYLSLLDGKPKGKKINLGEIPSKNE